MSDENPLVSVCMLAYNIEPFIAQAIAGVLSQKTSFPLELVIGEDYSEDGTLKVCEMFAKKYPEKIRVLPSDINRGIAGNAARTLAHCRGKYVAICDGDDIWTDPFKLARQVAFLEEHPDYGIVYSDVDHISADGNMIDDEIQVHLRSCYREGQVFFELLKGNFINNSTAVFRRRFLEGHEIDQDANYYIHDHLLWLHIALQAKVHFLNCRTTSYRRHIGGVTQSTGKIRENRKKFLRYLPEFIVRFDENYPWTISEEEKSVLFRKMMSVLYRREVSLKMKWQTLALMHKYFPGVRSTLKILIAKVIRVLSPPIG